MTTASALQRRNVFSAVGLLKGPTVEWTRVKLVAFFGKVLDRYGYYWQGPTVQLFRATHKKRSVLSAMR